MPAGHFLNLLQLDQGPIICNILWDNWLKQESEQEQIQTGSSKSCWKTLFS